MADNPRPPVAVRIVRPYESEDEFLESELETVGKTSVILIGAHSRPTGVILRFEVTLASGATVLRGEGRVLAHKENAFRGQPGLALRFTRLDPKSKALVDRAAAIREARLASDSVRPPPAPEALERHARGSVAPSVPPSVPPRESVTPNERRASAPPQRPPSMRAPERAMESQRPSRPPQPSADPALTQILATPTPPPPPLRGSQPPADRPTSVPSARALSELAEASRRSRPDPAELADRSADGEAEPQHIPQLAAPVVEVPLAQPPSHSRPRSEAPVTPSLAPPQRERSVATTLERSDVRTVERPADRDELLERLRQRHTTLHQDQIAAILRR